MRKITTEELKEILRKHELWLDNDSQGEKANLREADLNGADLYGTDLYRVNLSGAYLGGADLGGAYLYEAEIDVPMVCLEKGSFTGYKKCKNGLIVELEIPEDALRSSATTRKCRCSKAKVISITNLDGSKSEEMEAISNRDSFFVYKLGETVEVPDFDPIRWNECSTGIHFFMTRKEAVDYGI